MLLVTAKIDKKKLISWGAGTAALILLLLLAVKLLGTGTAAGLFGAQNEQNGADDTSRIAYLESWGWTVDPTPLSVEELTIPENFDETYQQYLILQEEQGFDLTRYRGKQVTRYTYAITNYPTGETGVQAGLLVYQGTVIGGDVLSPQLDGFIHGLDRSAL